jgi:rhodanese-related sulfurtransferase
VFAEDLKANPEKLAVVDVRPPVHYGIVSLPGSINIPFKRIEREEEARASIA